MNRKINGWLMSRDVAIAEIQENEIIPTRQDLMPYHFAIKKGSLEEWLQSRTIDTKRFNSRLLRRALRLSDTATDELVLTVNAATITDSYWIKEKADNLTYEDVCFKGNEFADIALLGCFSDYGKPYSRTPELTNTGSFEKCWRQEDGIWWLYKVGESENLFSEMAAYKLAKHFGFDTAYYEPVNGAQNFIGKLKPGRGIIRTRDFTDGASVNFEPAASLGLRSDDMEYNYDRLLELSTQLAEQYLNLVTMDVLIYNLDRHAQNFGVLRDLNTGAILSLAPNYDNNLALLCGIHGMTERNQGNDQLLKEWKLLVQGHLIAKPLPELSEHQLKSIFDSIDCGVSKSDRETACTFVWKGYEMMSETMEQLYRYEQGTVGLEGIQFHM